LAKNNIKKMTMSDLTSIIYIYILSSKISLYILNNAPITNITLYYLEKFSHQ
jgi:hypothetical protein